MRIADREVGLDTPPYIIAELGVNHDGDVNRALQLVDAAARAGADAIKLQYFEADRLLSKAARLAEYQRAAGARDPRMMLRDLEMSLDEMQAVIDRARETGLHAIVTVFSVELVNPARTISWDAFKVASPDLINRPLIQALGGTGKPLILSTGAATVQEVNRSRRWLARRADIGFLQCVSSYPTPIQAAELEGIGALRALGIEVVGYSDHTQETETAAEAVQWGACILEKHLTYDRRVPGPDHAASLDPLAFAEYVRLAHEAWRRRGALIRTASVSAKSPLPIELDVRTCARQSLTAARDLAVGHVVEAGDLTIKRPGTGLEPWRLDEVIGGRIVAKVEADMPLMSCQIDLGVQSAVHVRAVA